MLDIVDSVIPGCPTPASVGDITMNSSMREHGKCEAVYSSIVYYTRYIYSGNITEEEESMFVVEGLGVYSNGTHTSSVCGFYYVGHHIPWRAKSATTNCGQPE